MKKIVLGLFLTASSSCYVLANTIEVEKDCEEGKFMLSDCYAQAVINHETACGVYVYSTKTPKYVVNCREGQAAGTTTTFYETRLVSGWVQGQGPDQPTTCLN